MSLDTEDKTAHHLEAKLRIFLPDIYEVRDEAVQPTSMGSAALKYDSDGKVAWSEIWGSFCDLAMAGGPPHRGTLLQPGEANDGETPASAYDEVVAEICRGVHLVTGLYAQASSVPGWVHMYCTSAAMAGWLARAMVMENVSARSKGLVLDLPVGSSYRIEKEIKNVITAIAKTYHYWTEHTSSTQQQEIASLLARMERESPLLQPESGRAERSEQLGGHIAKAIYGATSLRAANRHYNGWLGLECPGVHAAIWMMRALVVNNVLSWREETAVFVPINPLTDPDGVRIVRIVLEVHRTAVGRGIVEARAELSLQLCAAIDEAREATKFRDRQPRPDTLSNDPRQDRRAKPDTQPDGP